ncbi:MAG: type II methionyl aminopeptidase [Planctomycetota bacterium]|nr:type II methionyl aminopeptidase [Planctomycetota bacterium]
MDAEGLEKTRAAGKIAARCREWAREAIQPGVKLRTVLETIESMIREEGAAPAFPAQTSRNECAAHYCSSPDDETVYEEGDVVKVDMGVHVDGWIADTACTVDLSSDGRHAALIQASADALAAAISLAEPGRPVSEIGGAVERTITKAGFEPVRNLTGHGLDRWKVHCAPQIPSYGERGGGRLVEGMVVAIEPFACTGRGFIHEAGRAEVFMLVRPPRKARGVDKEVLKAMQSWRGLPIARRYFDHLDRDAVEDTISKLARQGVLVRYPPLVEQSGVLVAQTEHTLFLGPDGVEIITA